MGDPGVAPGKAIAIGVTARQTKLIGNCPSI
jgi:hypothetical protein